MSDSGGRDAPGLRNAFLLGAAGLLGLTGVACGAFGAHALQGVLSPERLGTWETAVLYQLVHVPAVLALGLAGADPRLKRAGHCLVLGVLLFSGSLYLLAFGAPGWLGPITPLGGLFLMVGWALVLYAVVRGPAIS
ncbi:MAG: DUF423 domain-containing protein [Pseudomonadota bacterium]